MKKNLSANHLLIVRKKTFWLLINLFLLIQTGLIAQNLNVKGVVKSVDGTTLPGVNVVIKGTTIGTSTDGNGNFSISAPAGGTLVFSYIGSLVGN